MGSALGAAARRLNSWLAGAALSLAASAGCAPAPVAKPRPSLLSGRPVQAAFESPATWVYHPPEPVSAVTAALPLSNGQLLLTQHGERWWALPDARHADVAAVLAREPLVDARQLPDSRWLFVGASGATYRAPSPLGAFDVIDRPPARMARLASAAAVLLGVTRAGQLLRSEDLGANWQDVAIPGRATDVALLPSGHGLLLLAPEQLLATSDFGRTWSDTKQGPFGAMELAADRDAITVRGVLSTQRYVPGATELWQEAQAARPARLAVSAPRRANGKALGAARAVLTQGVYYEFERSGAAWQLYTGDELGVVSPREVPALQACADVRVAALGKLLLVACSTGGEGVVGARFFSSSDAGASFQPEPIEVRASFELLRLGVLASAHWLVSGVCPSHAAEGGCSPRGVYVSERAMSAVERVAPDSARTTSPSLPAASAAPEGPRLPGLQPLSLPLLQGIALGLAVSDDGERVLLIGKRSKGSGLSAFVGDLPLGRFEVEDLSGFDAVWEEGISLHSPVSVRSLVVGPDGQYGVTLFDRSAGQWKLLTLDRRGRIVTRGEAPKDGAVPALAGSFGLAIDGKSGRAWESLDGGVSWQDIGSTPSTLCDADRQRCQPELWCSARGCVASDRFSRIGWRGQSEASPRVSGVDSTSTAIEQPSLKTPIGCRFEESSEWRRYPGARAPGVEQAQFGEVEWFSLDVEFERGGVGIFEATAAQREPAERIALFDAAKAPRETALAAEPQVEGMAALRVVKGRPAEVVWRNLVEGRRTLRGTLPADANVTVRPSRFPLLQAEPQLLSVSSGGLFVRLQDKAKVAPSYLVTTSGVQTLPPFAWPTLQPPGRAEMVLAQGVPLALTFIDDGAALVRQRPSAGAGAWQRDAVTLGLLRTRSFDVRQTLNLAYRGTAPGLHLVLHDDEQSNGFWFPFSAGTEAVGAAARVPTQRDLPALARICDSGARGSTPRVVVPAEPPTRHPIVITHTTEPIPALLSNSAVLFGTPEAPCLAVLEAQPVQEAGRQQIGALIIPDKTRASWVFRRSLTGTEFEARQLRCGFDANLEVPSELSAQGAASR